MESPEQEAPVLRTPFHAASGVMYDAPAVQIEILGTRIQYLRTAEVLRKLLQFIEAGQPRSVYIANAATLNLAYSNAIYRAVLNRADLVLNDGTGVRWAARAQGIELRDNNVGTDLIPRLCEYGAKRPLRLYLLGGRPGVADEAGQTLADRYPGVTVVGTRHGYFLPSEEDAICEEINAAQADLVLVALGNPFQELWIDRHLAHLQRGVVVGVGGLFDHLSHNLRRAPLWMRQAGMEWVHILLQQPHKWRRYILGNPLFLYRMRFGQPRRRHAPTPGVSRLRWHVKKAARVSVALLSQGSGLLALQRRFSRKPRVRVLTYHRFRHAPRDPFSVSPAAFRQQMEWLARKRLVISLADLEAFLDGQRTLPQDAVLITVDDGYHDFWVHALPVLRRLDLPAVVFIPCGEIPAASDAHGVSQLLPNAPEARLSWQDIQALPAYGVAVGSHAWQHQSLGPMSREQVYEQAYRSRQELAKHVPEPVGAFAYPYGTRADYNAMTQEILRDIGYTCAFTTQHGAIRPGAALYALPRIKVEGGEGLWLFRLLTRGGLDAWGWMDRFLWWLQQSRN